MRATLGADVSLRQFTARRAFFSFLGPEFRFFRPDGTLALFVKQKAFRLREEITAFVDEARTSASLRIKARSIMDVRATYDVADATSGQTVGTCKRAGFKSLLRDTWEIRGPDDALVANLQEDSLMLALVRRFFFKAWLPQTFSLTTPDGRRLGGMKQRFNPFVLIYDVDLGAEEPGALDARLGQAAVVLLLAIEGRQQ
jgi:uncharacterized protein YxjI